MTPEGKIKAEVHKVLKNAGLIQAKDAPLVVGDHTGWYYMPGQNGFGVKGIPDFIGHYKGRFFSIETKAPGKKPSAFQKLQIKAIELTGGKNFVIDSEAGIERLVEWLEML